MAVVPGTRLRPGRRGLRALLLRHRLREDRRSPAPHGALHAQVRLTEIEMDSRDRECHSHFDRSHTFLDDPWNTEACHRPGSPRRAGDALEDVLRLPGGRFHQSLRPNIAVCPVCAGHARRAAGGQPAGRRVSRCAWPWRWNARSPPPASSPARIIFTPTCPRATRSPSTSSPWRAMAGWRS